MLAKQIGKVIYVTAPLGFDMDDGRILLSLREARMLRDELVAISYNFELDEGAQDEDG